jgi:hypothetical protein
MPVRGGDPGDPLNVGVARAAISGRDHRRASGLCLEQDKAETFADGAAATPGLRGQHEQVRCGQLASEVAVAQTRADHAPGMFRDQAQQAGRRIPAAADGEADVRTPQSRHRCHQLSESLALPLRQPEGGYQPDPWTALLACCGCRCGKSVKPLSRQSRRQDCCAAVPHERARGKVARRHHPYASASHQAALQVSSRPPP